MKVNFYLSAAGCEGLALGREVYSWEVIPKIVGSYRDEAPENSILLGSCEFANPSVGNALTLAEAELRKKLSIIKAEAFVEEKQIRERLNALLVLQYTPATAQDREPG